MREEGARPIGERKWEGWMEVAIVTMATRSLGLRVAKEVRTTDVWICEATMTMSEGTRAQQRYQRIQDH